MNYLDLVREYFPRAWDATADHILWEFTIFPIVKDENVLRSQLKELILSDATIHQLNQDLCGEG